MSVVFVGTSASDFIGAMTAYIGTAQSRDTDYASEEIAALCASNVSVAPFETPKFTISGNLIWVHFRVVFPTGSDSGSADGLFMSVRNSDGDTLGGIEWQNGNMLAFAGFNTGGSFSQSPGTVYTIDLKVDCSSGTDVELYVDGSLVSTASSGSGTETPAFVLWDLNDMLGVGNPNADVYLSEVMVDDVASTVGCRVHTATGDTAGTYTEMAGSVSAVQDAFDSDFLLADANGERFSWNPPAYSGDVSGVAVRSVLVKTSAIMSVSGPTKMTPFLRINGTDYYGAQSDPGPGSPVLHVYEWQDDPDASGSWDIADMGTFEIGIRAYT